jgi:hypothetical protein
MSLGFESGAAGKRSLLNLELLGGSGRVAHPIKIFAKMG